jgi:hypothetical protein
MTEPTQPAIRVPDHALQHAPPSPVNRVLGSTAGDSAGNVRAILAITLTVVASAILFYVTVEYVHNGHTEARDLVNIGFGALIAAFNAVVFLYFGARIAQTKGG